MTKNYWRNTAITLLFAVGIDYLIANWLAGYIYGVWEWFAILMIVPLVFAIKVGFIRIVLWKAFIKNEVVAVYLEMLKALSFPKPSSDYQDADDYLIDVMNEEKNTDAMRIEAAKTYGYMRALYETQQVVGALQMSSAIKAAMVAYEETIDLT
ncbi:hypothetical protein MCEKH37_01635 [Methylophilaceae bacterium]